MAKALRTAAFIVGAVALAATGVGAAVSAGLIAASATTATIATIATVASVASGVLTLAVAATAPKGTVGGNATKFTIDKESGIPVVLGRTYVGGKVVHRQYYDDPGSKMKNQRESWVTALSLGPVFALGPLLIDKTTAVTFDAGKQAVGFYHGNMWLDEQLGACPEARALAGPTGNFPGWDASSKLSGIAADLWTLDFDSKNKKFPNGVPQRGRIVQGVPAYDPRQDSTYPGGSGACRIGDRATWIYSESPALHAISWSYGHWQNGVKMAGGGLPASGIDLQPFVEWANVCDANGWKVGGLVFTDSDDPWDVLKMICQAGSAEPMMVGAQLSVTFSAPRVSIGTITSEDISGDVDVPAGVSRRARRNTVIPKVRLESHGWEEVPLDPVVVADYVTVDGGSRPKEISYPLVQDADQGATLAAYDILNMREIDGITIPLKIYAMGYRPGDQLDANIPEGRLVNQPVVVRNRGIAAATLGVTLSCRTETAGKHAYALSRTGAPPPTPSLGAPPPDTTAPDADDWDLVGASLSGPSGAVPAIVVTGNPGTLAADAIVIEYRPVVADADDEANWIAAGVEVPTIQRKEIVSVTPGAQYQASIRYRTRGVLTDRLILGPVTAGAVQVPRASYSVVAYTGADYIVGGATINSISINAATATLDDGRVINLPAATIAGLAAGTWYGVFRKLSTNTYFADLQPASASLASSDNVFLGWQATQVSGGGSYPSSPTPPGGNGGTGPRYRQVAQ